VCGVKICMGGLYAFVFRIIDDIFDVTEIVCDHVLFFMCAIFKVCMYCKKISEKMPEDTAP
jgi:hypothetical protein